MNEYDRERLALRVFGEVCALPQAQQQAAINAHCGDDPLLRQRVAALLDADGEPIAAFGEEARVDGYLASRIHDFGGDPDGRPAASRMPGHYRILRVLGEGGMATVYEAEQVHPRRLVAIKVLRGGLFSAELRRRFEYEAQVLAGLAHPGIAQLYEAETRHGGPGDEPGVQAYLAMELVRGVPIDEYAASHNHGVREKLELILCVCDAVEYAHRMGVVHRDLKPANILVSADGRPKVLDFGVARVIRRDHVAEATLTQAGQLMGTLPYMSPEQVDSGLGAADTRCDVYALGVLLHKLLTGALPIDVGGDAIASAISRIRTEQPPKIGSYDRRLRGDLEVIVAKALEKEPGRRYLSVQALAEDLQRFLDGRAIEARADSALYVLRKTVWRFRRTAAVVVAFLLLVGCFGIYARTQASRSRRLAAEAVAARDQSVADKGIADARSSQLRHSLYLSNIGFAQSALASHDVARVRELLAQCPADLRGWEWQYLSNQCDQSVASRPLASGGNARPAAPSSVDITRDHTRLAIGTTDGTALVIDNKNGAVLFDRRFAEGGAVAIAISPDGARLACGARMDELSVIDLATGQRLWSPAPGPTPRYPLLRRLRALRFSADGRLLASAGYDGRLRLHNAATGELLWDVNARCLSILCLAFTPDGIAIAGGDNTGVARLWRTADGVVLQETRAHEDAIGSLAISADGRQLATGGSDGQVSVRSVQDWSESTRLRVGNCILWSIAFSPDGASLAFGADDNLVRLWRPPTLAIEAVFRGHAAQVNFVIFEADGRHLSSAAADETLRRWRIDGTAPAVTLTPGNAMTQDATFTPDGKRVLVACNDGTVRAWDVATGAESWRHHGDLATLRSLTLDAAHHRIAVADHLGAVRVIDMADGKLIHTLAAEKPGPASPGYVPGGKLLAVAYQEGGVKLWDTRSAQALSEFPTPPGTVSLAVHPRGRTLATAGADGVVRLWSLPEGLLLASSDSGAAVIDVRFSPDGTSLAYSRDDGAIILADGMLLKPLREFAGHRGAVTGLAFHPSGKRLASGGADRTIRLWDVTSGQEVLSLRGHLRQVHRLAFSPDGSVLASSSADRTARLWDATPRP